MLKFKYYLLEDIVTLHSTILCFKFLYFLIMRPSLIENFFKFIPVSWYIIFILTHFLLSAATDLYTPVNTGYMFLPYSYGWRQHLCQLFNVPGIFLKTKQNEWSTL